MPFLRLIAFNLAEGTPGKKKEPVIMAAINLIENKHGTKHEGSSH